MIEEWIIISTIELLLQIHNIKYILYTYSSIFEMYKKKYKSIETLYIYNKKMSIIKHKYDMQVSYFLFS